MNQVFKLCPCLKDLISHVLCYDELAYSEDGSTVYKDLSYLAHNRVTNLEASEDDQVPQASEIMVIDIQDGHNCADPNYVTYF